MTEKETFIHTHDRECQTTENLLKAFPASKMDLRPSEKSRTARELAYVLANQELFFKQAAEGTINPDAFMKPQPPATTEEIIHALEKNSKAVDETLKKTSEADLNKSINFGGQPIRRLDLFWAGLFSII